MGEDVFSWLEGVIDREYEIEKIFKRDADMQIYLMINKANGKRVIVRKYEGDVSAYKKLVRIRHENIPIIYEAISKGDKCIVIEEYIEGLTIGDVLETGRYKTKGVERVVYQLINALDVLHSNNIVHRDIKPENIMVDKNGVVKLVDYNISRVYQEGENADTTILGTAGFAAPEQFGFAQTDPRTDIYALGILINVMLTGEHPSKKMCSGKWRKIVKKCTQINPEERYQRVREVC